MLGTDYNSLLLIIIFLLKSYSNSYIHVSKCACRLSKVNSLKIMDFQPLIYNGVVYFDV